MSNRTPATKEELVSLAHAIRTITAEEEMREYCRKMVWSRLLRIRYDDWRNHRYLLRDFWDDIYNTKAWGAYDWYDYIEKFMSEVVIITENYSVKKGYLKTKNITRSTYSGCTLMDEMMSTYISCNDDGEIAEDEIEAYRGTMISREIYPDDGNPQVNTEVEVREFEDRYEERIIPPYIEKDRQRPNDYDPSTVIKKVTYKHDLFRSETFKPIHDELLYSPDLQLIFATFINEATRAKEHYESLHKVNLSTI